MMFRVGVLYRVGEVLDFLSSHQLTEEQFLRSFDSWDGVAGTSVVQTCKRLGWVAARSTDELLLTQNGKAICEIRRPHDRLRLQLEQMIGLLRPAWAAMAVRGRNAVLSYAPADTVQCLRDADLVHGTSEEVVAWWDRLAGYYRSVRDDEHMVTGRQGERCSFEWERRRTAVEPVWTALSTNDAGYDLLSRLSKTDDRRLLIEVKASTLDWEDAEAILSRHEWDVLSRSSHAYLDLWSLASSPYAFLRVPIDVLRCHIPEDKSEARWLSLSLPFHILGQPILGDPAGTDATATRG